MSHRTQIDKLINSMHTKIDVTWESIADIKNKLNIATRNFKDIRKSSANLRKKPSNRENFSIKYVNQIIIGSKSYQHSKDRTSNKHVENNKLRPSKQTPCIFKNNKRSSG